MATKPKRGDFPTGRVGASKFAAALRKFNSTNKTPKAIPKIRNKRGRVTGTKSKPATKAQIDKFNKNASSDMEMAEARLPFNKKAQAKFNKNASSDAEMAAARKTPTPKPQTTAAPKPKSVSPSMQKYNEAKKQGASTKTKEDLGMKAWAEHHKNKGGAIGDKAKAYLKKLENKKKYKKGKNSELSIAYGGGSRLSKLMK
tara:strand:- start:856 stop:1455 length:600 start_codon:yes stop_codon:yes gene_type:complete